jgi:transposase-like protein
MVEISYRRHRFPPVVIQHAVWLYLRFTLSYRDVEDLLAERGLDISHETQNRPKSARRLARKNHPKYRQTRASTKWIVPRTALS